MELARRAKEGPQLKQGVSQNTSLRTSLSVRVDPRVMLASSLAQLTQSEIEQAVDTELQENPALERLEEPDSVTEETILRSVAPAQLRPTSEDYEWQRSLPAGSEDVDWVSLMPSSNSLADHLRAQLLGELPPGLQHAGEYLIGCIDERGYLSTPVEEVALDCQCSLEDAELAIKLLQRCNPPGVGARTLQEALCLQLRGERSIEARLARLILKDSFDEFLARDVRALARKYKALPEVVSDSIRLITSLAPYPAEGWNQHEANGGELSGTVLPEVVLSLSANGWTVTVPFSHADNLIVNREYRTRLRERRSHGPSERRHLSEYVERAQRFIGALRQREGTLLKIGAVLIERQTGFVSTGQYHFLQPLTRSELAQRACVHESTVSRATMNKFVQIATGEVVPFEVFFKPALRVQRMIEEILATENPGNPLSDQQIAKMLAERGVRVARRTVNKYRDRTRLLSSRRRRTA